LANVAFLGAVISLPTPAASFFLPGTTTYHPSPPPTPAIIDNVLPTNNLKAHLTKGLQSPSPLVRHSTALTLARCLRKYDCVIATFREVADALEEEEDGQWRQAVVALEVEARRRVPELQVVIAFSQQKSDTVQEKSTSVDGGAATTLKPLTVSMISESALRILWLYYKCLPTLVAEARFDSGKLLWSFLHCWSGEVQGQSVDGWDMLRRLHVLRLLKESDQFSWSGKTGNESCSRVLGLLAYHDHTASNSNLRILLQGYLETRAIALRREIGLLLRHVLANDPLFQHDPDEIYIWLGCIPSNSARSGTKSPDGVELLDDGPIIVKFLDECFLRCAKTPYKYLEDLSAVVPSPSYSELSVDSIVKRPELFPTPVLMTVLEQLSVLVKQNPSPSDLYSLSVFIRHLIFRLAQKTQSLRFVQVVTERVDAIFGDGILPNHPSITKAVQREVRILRACLAGLENPPLGTSWTVTNQMQTFLAKIEGTPLGTLFDNSRSAAFEVDIQE
jgi:nucleolar pre-ribosomal-associated protein 1